MAIHILSHSLLLNEGAVTSTIWRSQCRVYKIIKTSGEKEKTFINLGHSNSCEICQIRADCVMILESYQNRALHC
jgi:hypothetical protein